MSDVFGRFRRREQHGRVSVSQKAEEMPQFMRTYTVALDGGFTVEVEIGYWSLGRRDHSVLTQRNGKRITFDVDAIADKIIDRDLYPRVQAAVDEILALDEAYRRSKPTEFIDEQGVTWRRA